MVPHEVLVKWCRSLDDSQPFYRPFVCRTYAPTRKSLWIVGTNPATPIDASEITVEEYASKLLDYDIFNAFYSEARKKRQKRIWSPTRRGIQELGDWLIKETYMNIIETNINVFPSQDPDDLDNGNIPSAVVEQGNNIFTEMLCRFHPQILIVHGSTRTLPQLKKLVSSHPDMRWEKVQLRQVELEAIRFRDDNLSLILPCTHLRFYRDKRYHDEFERLREQIQAVSFTPPAMKGDADVSPMQIDARASR